MRLWPWIRQSKTVKMYFHIIECVNYFYKVIVRLELILSSLPWLPFRDWFSRMQHSNHWTYSLTLGTWPSPIQWGLALDFPSSHLLHPAFRDCRKLKKLCSMLNFKRMVLVSRSELQAIKFKVRTRYFELTLWKAGYKHEIYANES